MGACPCVHRVDIWWCTHENDETDFFKEVEMAHMEEVESSSNINNLLSRLRAIAVRKLVGISTISTYNSHADCTKMDDLLQISRMTTWRSFWVVGRNCETPVQGDLAEESVLISELRLWSTLKVRNTKYAKCKKSQMCKKIGIANSSLSRDFAPPATLGNLSKTT